MKSLIIRILLIAALMPAVVSCKIGKKYVRPDLDLPQLIDSTATDSSSVKDIEWQTLFADPALQDLIYKALDYNKDLKIAVARVNELAEQKRISTADMLPSIGGQFYGRKEGMFY